MFRSRKGAKKTQGKRQVDADDEAVADLLPVAEAAPDAMDAGADDSVEAIRLRLQKKHKKPLGTTTTKKRAVAIDLDDEDAPEFRVRKGKIARVDAPVETERASTSGAGEYSREKLAELLAQQNYASTAAPTTHEAPAIDDEAPVVVERPTELPASPPPDAPFVPESFIPMTDRRRAPPPVEEASLSEPDDVDMANDDDDGTDARWENEQLRRAGLPIPAASPVLQQRDLSFQSFGSLLLSLEATHEALTERVDLRDRDRMRASVDAAQASSAIRDLESQLEKDAQTFDVAQDMWEYLSTLCFCLRAKLDSISSIEALVPQDKRMLGMSDAIWADVDDDYSDLQHVLERFAAWKTADAGMYAAAYGDLALAQLVCPYIRVELATWQPWTSSRTFQDMRWSSLLEDDALHEAAMALVQEHLRRYLPHLNVCSPTQLQNLRRLVTLLAPESRPIHAEMLTQCLSSVQALDFASMGGVDLRLLKDGVKALCASDARYDSVLEALLEGEARHWMQRCATAGTTRSHVQGIAAAVELWPLGKKFPNLLVNYAVLLRRFVADATSDTDVTLGQDVLARVEAKIRG
ncbi:hypothetical protein SPRG_15462 [Saprolegnia parasitica CBS 223.65]|uniref:GCF C-terminal domain-containing protein n=1 Tax=Saprolegnia parasitica (strain CBS 223.65) TaxID=695850 RepID=A0A067BXS3_SAPPC|nr:hypothetical protein SPRG_15462 [Saprolegnia parasitica CBS 223.65]KDO19372.1 hypothetical protein SPRG_15462 [Saprolegnia parasitica CBS 223.65]|eukprot:XP_012209918.1 hypothetical protein SPRG_15462 [Saprolegnia parasitica CBS 223.65]